jgi:hypothetical protein
MKTKKAKTSAQANAAAGKGSTKTASSFSSRIPKAKRAQQKPPPTSTIVFPPKSDRPLFRCYHHPFLVNGEYQREGVYFHGVTQDKDQDGKPIDVLVDLWICSVLIVLCILRSNSG